jgi:hypothetical protein
MRKFFKLVPYLLTALLSFSFALSISNIANSLKTPPQAQSQSTAAILDSDEAIYHAASIMAKSCVAFAETIPEVKPLIPMIAPQLCNSVLVATLTKNEAGRGECVLTDDHCLYTVACIRTARPLKIPTATPEERLALVNKCESLYNVFKASQGK